MLSTHRVFRAPRFFLMAALFLAWAAVAEVRAVSADQLFTQAQEKIEREDYAGAITDLDRAIAAAPEEALYYFHRAFAKNTMADATGAMADANKALRLNVELAGAYELRAGLKERAGDREGGIADYDAAIALKPLGLFRLQINRAMLAYQLDRHVEAVAAMNDVLENTTFPAYASAAHQVRGMARAGLHDYAGAVADFTKALELKYARPENAYFERAKARFHLLDFPGAKKDIAELLKGGDAAEDRERYSEWFLLGCLLRTDDWEASNEAFERAYKMSPANCRTALLMRHEMLRAHRRHNEDDVLAEAAKTWKDDPWRVKLAAFVLGEIEPEELEKEAEKLATGPNEKSVRCELFFYRAMMMRDGEEEETKRLLKEAIATNQLGQAEHTLARYIGKEVFEISP
jgi:tetratricopeptide (TPR) repeat protein